MVGESALGLLLARPAGEEGSDALARAARGGDLGAFEALVKRYQRRVYGLAYHQLHDPVEAQDLAQEVFVRLYRNLGRFDPTRAFEPWFWRLAANVAASYGRKRVAVPAELPAGAVAPAAPEDALPLEQALADLAPALRLPVLLHYYLDLGLEDIAAALGLTVPAVKSRLHRARRVLRRVLVEEP
jgi:RNA polymerase sigma-70 factor (ECF subfamily)